MWAQKNKIIYTSLAIILVFPALVFLLTSKTQAATLAKTLIRTDRMLTSQATTGMICAQPGSSSSNINGWQVVFPTGYTVGAASNWNGHVDTTNTGSWPSGAAAWPGLAGATASVSTQTVTWAAASAQTMNTGTMYCFNWSSTAALSNQSSASAQNSATVNTCTNTSCSSTQDTGTAALGTVANDQITVTASVNQLFKFSLSGSTDALGALQIASVSTSPTPRTINVDTNAVNGWYTWGKDSNQGLNSSAASYTISSNCSGFAGTNSTLSGGTEGYNLGVTTSQTSGTGTITVQTPFVGGSLGKGGGLCKDSGTTSGYQVLTSSNGTGGGAVLTLNNNAAISSTTQAASDYTDTETFVGAGAF